MKRHISLWLTTRRLAFQQTALDKCACCRSDRVEFLFDANNYAGNPFIARGFKRGRYSICHHCGVVFAALRPSAAATDMHYDLFKEGGDDVEDVLELVKTKKDKKHMQLLIERQLLHPGMAVLHVRSDGGGLLQFIRERVPDAKLHALEYFDSRIELLRKNGFAADRVKPSYIELPFGTEYDLIISNHQLTHALDPRHFLATITGALKLNGKILFYNEIDHDLEINPASEHYRDMDIISYHKQLFVRESIEALLREAGLQFEYLGQTRANMRYLAHRAADMPRRLAIAPEVIERQRSYISQWQKDMEPRRTAYARRDLRQYVRHYTIKKPRRFAVATAKHAKNKARQVLRPVRLNFRRVLRLPIKIASRLILRPAVRTEDDAQRTHHLRG